MITYFTWRTWVTEFWHEEAESRSRGNSWAIGKFGTGYICFAMLFATLILDAFVTGLALAIITSGWINVP